MKTDFLTQIVHQKKEDIAMARSVIPQIELEAMAKAKSPSRPFFDRLKQPGPGGVNIIAEIKRASPSKGDIRPDLDPGAYARQYEKGGAAAISVLTDAPYFSGSIQDMMAAKANSSIPVLRKEFIISEYQVYESAAANADAILLIARILKSEELKHLLDLCHGLDMDALVEIHSPEDAEKAVFAKARLVGINNRNLSTFKTDLNVAMELVSQLTPDQVPVAASGISGPDDINANLDAGIFNFLIGESIVRSHNPAAFIRKLIDDR